MGDSSEEPSSPRGAESEKPDEEKDTGDNLQDVELQYRDEFANEVLLFTSLDDFHEGVRMERVTESGDSGGDLFQCLVQFPPGRHLYRYLVDGEWMCDEIKEVTYLQGNAYNEIEVEQPSASMSKSALKRKAKRARWRQKKKIAKARKRALESIDDGKDPKTQNRALADALKSLNESSAHKLSQAEEVHAKEIEDLKNKMKAERDTWIQKIKNEQTEKEASVRKATEHEKEAAALKEKLKSTQLEAEQNNRRVQDLETEKKQLNKEKGDLEKEKGDVQEKHNVLARKLKTLQGELKAKFEKQIEEVTAAMEAELRNTSVNIFYLKKEIEKHTKAAETAEAETKKVQAELDVIKSEKNALQLTLESTKVEAADVVKKLSEAKKEAGGSSTELQTVRDQLEKLTEKYKTESAHFTQKLEEHKRAETALSAEKASLVEAEQKSHAEIKKLNDQNFKLRSDMTSSQARYESDMQTLREQLHAEHEGLKAEKSTVEKKMETHLQEKEKVLTGVQGRLEELKKERDDLIAEHEKASKELTDKIKVLNEEKEKLERELSAAKAEVKSLTDAKGELETKSSSTISELKTKISGLEAAKEELETAAKKAAADHLSLTQQKGTLEASAKAAEAKAAAEIADLSKKLEAEVKTTGDLTSELDKEKKSHAKVASQAETSEQRIKDLEKEKTSMTEDHSQMRTELEGKLTGARDQITQLQGELQSTKNQVEKARDELKVREGTLQKELGAVKKDLEASTAKVTLLKKGLKKIASDVKESAGQVQALKLIQVQAASGTSKALGLFEKNITRSIEQYSKLLEETLQKYKKEMTERRKYFNLVQELRGNIRVSIRARPLIEHDIKRKDIEGDAPTMALKFPDVNVVGVTRQGQSKEYEFDRVFETTLTQSEVFKDTSYLIRSVMDGYNVCIIAYGQTGSGKTFTMEGPEHDRGVNFRALKELFSIKKKRAEDYVYEISVSMMEIYNESLNDLLAEKREESSKVNIRHGKDGIYLENITEVEVENEEDVIKYMKLGHSNRSIGKTNMNEHSSRSHSILTVTVQGHNFTAGIAYFGKLHLIDLAGSERVSKSGATGERLKEAQAINKSLSALGNVLHNLQLKSKHVPYRDSKLTYLLQDSLGGNSKCMMFINLSPSSADIEETFCSLEFASRVARVELGQATQNKTRKGAAAGTPTDSGEAPPTDTKSPTATGTKAPKATGSGTATTTGTAPKAAVKSPGVAAPGTKPKTTATGTAPATKPATTTTAAPPGAAKSPTPGATGAKKPATGLPKPTVVGPGPAKKP